MKLKYRITVSILNLISKTWRIRSNSMPEKPAIVVFWHGKMLPVWKIFSKSKPFGVVSLSRDGRILSSLLEKWDFCLIRGSSSKGGREVLKSIVEVAVDNYVLLTPDGPRGPVYEFKAGAVIAAQRANTKLYLCSVNIRKGFTFDSWDKFILPMPFSKIILEFSEPISVDKECSKPEVNKIIQDCQIKMRVGL